jgi:hypothetical protein
MIVDNLSDSKEDFIPILSSTMIIDKEDLHLVCMAIDDVNNPYKLAAAGVKRSTARGNAMH